MAGPTRFDDLNGVLVALVDGTRDALGASLGGVYLQGSFALGEADEHSDVDFLVVVDEELTDPQVDRLQDLHRRLYEIEIPWAQHLEGSYAPARLVRDVDPTRTKLWFLDNGATQLALDDHCNTAVVRWITREHGIVLAGPEPATFISHVDSDALRAEARRAALASAAWAPEPTRTGGMSRWKQSYLVITCCRLLHTIESGTVVPKQRAGAWALAALAPEWSDLIQAAIDDRPDPWGRVWQPAPVEVAERTLAFVAYATHLATEERLPGRMLPRR